MNINSISAYPENPYSPPISGVFHEQSPRDTTVPGKYTVYIPDSFQPCSPAVMILAPDYTTAQSFYE